MNSLLSYCGLVDVRINAFDNDACIFMMEIVRKILYKLKFDFKTSMAPLCYDASDFPLLIDNVTKNYFYFKKQ